MKAKCKFHIFALAAFENEILAIQARKEQNVMEIQDEDPRPDPDMPAEKDRIGLTEVGPQETVIMP